AKGKFNVLKKYVNWMLSAVRLAKKNKRDLSMTHAHYVFPSGLISLYLKKRFNIPYIVTAHGGDINKMAKKNEQIRKMSAAILQNASHVIAVGEELAATIERDFGISSGKLTVMSMGIDRDVFKPATDKEKVQQELGFDRAKKNFLFVGNVIQEKGVEELVLAFNEIVKTEPNATLTIIGSTKDRGFFEKIEPIAKANPAITFVEPMPQPQLVRYFQAADAFVLPSYIEGLGLVALEAMACGTPVIAANVGGLHYMLKDGAGQLVEPKSVEQLAEALRKELHGEFAPNEDEIARLLALHDSKRIIDHLCAIYEEHKVQ
ncbi:MAG: glycosyltransferase, partial [Lysinibacillus sp.]